jgi:hypothetical protein
MWVLVGLGFAAVALALVAAGWGISVVVLRMPRRRLATEAFIVAGIFAVLGCWHLVLATPNPDQDWTRLTLDCDSPLDWLGVSVWTVLLLVPFALPVLVAGIMRVARLRDVAGFAVVLCAFAMAWFGWAVIFLAIRVGYQTSCD